MCTALLPAPQAGSHVYALPIPQTGSFACIDAITLCKPRHISFRLFKLSHLAEEVLNLALKLISYPQDHSK